MFLIKEFVYEQQIYACKKRVYFCTENDKLLELANKMPPDIAYCVETGAAPKKLVERAIKYRCQKIQLFKSYFNQEMIDKAYENGIYCNVFWLDDAEETETFLRMGIDIILTSDYNLIAIRVEKYNQTLNR